MHTTDRLLEATPPSEVASASFQIVRRGYDPVEVQAFARAVSAELQRLSHENQELRGKLRGVEARLDLNETSIAQYLGDETTKLLAAARETAGGIVSRAEQRSQEITTKANEDARKLRAESASDAAAERRRAAEEARDLIADASGQRRSVLSELARRRDAATAQMQELMRGRDVLVQALAHVSGTSAELIDRLEAITVEPGDFVNLDPGVNSTGDVVDRGAVLKVSSRTAGALRPPPAGTTRSTRATVPATSTAVGLAGSGPVSVSGRPRLVADDVSEAPVYVLES